MLHRHLKRKKRNSDISLLVSQMHTNRTRSSRYLPEAVTNISANDGGTLSPASFKSFTNSIRLILSSLQNQTVLAKTDISGSVVNEVRGRITCNRFFNQTSAHFERSPEHEVKLPELLMYSPHQTPLHSIRSPSYSALREIHDSNMRNPLTSMRFRSEGGWNTTVVKETKAVENLDQVGLARI